MNLELIDYSYEDKDFEIFISNSQNGTFMSTKRFLSYHGDKFKNIFLGVTSKNEIVSTLVGTTIFEDQKKIFYSHPGASFGGIILNYLDYSSSLEVFNLYKNWLNKNNYNSLIYKDLPRDNLINNSESLNYIFNLNKIKILKSELSTFIDLTNQYEFIYSNFNNLTKRIIKKNKSLFETRISNNKKDLNSFYNILIDNLKTRHSAFATHTLNDLSYLFNEFDQIKLFITSDNTNNQMASGIIVFELNNQIALAFYIATNQKFLNYSPVRSTISTAIEFYQKQGFKSFNFGISTENSGKQVNEGLIKFKEGFGGFNVIRNTLELTL